MFPQITEKHQPQTQPDAKQPPDEFCKKVFLEILILI